MTKTFNRGRMGVLIACILVMLASLLLAAYSLAKLSKTSHQNSTALKALCFQRDDLDKRISTTDHLLRDHVGGVVFGIPRALITSGLKQQMQTRQNLSILDCPEDR